MTVSGAGNLFSMLPEMLSGPSWSPWWLREVYAYFLERLLSVTKDLRSWPKSKGVMPARNAVLCAGLAHILLIGSKRLFWPKQLKCIQLCRTLVQNGHNCAGEWCVYMAFSQLHPSLSHVAQVLLLVLKNIVGGAIILTSCVKIHSFGVPVWARVTINVTIN